MMNLCRDRLSLDGVEVAVLDGEKLGFDLEGQAYAVRRTGFFGPLYELLRGDEVLASAKQSAIQFRFEVTSGAGAWTLKPEQWNERKFGLFDRDTRVGGVAPSSPKNYTIDLPEALPLETRVFLIWLLQWKWSAAS
jgi:hypothetical protein